MRIVDAMMQRIRMSTNKMMEQVTLNTYRNVRAGMGFSAEPDLAPLRAMLSERQSYFDERLKKYRWLVKRFDNPSKKIGRRGHDVIREISLDTLEEGFLRGNPTAFTSTELARKIVNKGTLFKSEEDALEALKGVQKDIINKIPLFNKDGELKFMLHTRAGGIYSGKFRAMDVERYADMVAFTTAGEANTAANIAQAGEIGTRIVKWNSTGKGV
ncbi:MAG TPA: hypothetical protein PLY93_11735, partial [Turneriella sp.]|nr:hypothetical protein [Turneriella sp.]